MTTCHNELPMFTRVTVHGDDVYLLECYFLSCCVFSIANGKILGTQDKTCCVKYRGRRRMVIKCASASIHTKAREKCHNHPLNCPCVQYPCLLNKNNIYGYKHERTWHSIQFLYVTLHFYVSLWEINVFIHVTYGGSL